ncbi:MAG: sigma 54-interacting transcriptional regulator [Dehalobacterium sp.]
MNSINKEKLESLERENQLLREIIDNVHEGVYVTNEKGEIILYNREVEKGEGMKREDVLNRKENEIYSFISENMFHEAITEKVKKNGKPIIEQHYKFNLADGRKMNMILSTFPFYFGDNLSAIYTIGRDVKQIGEFIARTLEIEKKAILEEYSQGGGARYFFEDIIGISDKICKAVSLARKVARHDSHILIVGETGTGKELFAHGIHNASLFSKGPFVPVNCAAIPDTLLESILFGTVKGAFTGAIDMPGLFEQAEDGTVFLDEINSMPRSLQAKLLRVLQDKAVRRIGSKTEVPVNCRIISATNIDPFVLEKDQIIREDLFFRLATVTVNIPPLRERKEDMPVLMMHFIKKYNAKFGVFVNNISTELISLFNHYSWPGNVRELENFIESSMNFVEKDERSLKLQHLPTYFRERILGTKKDSRNYTVKGTLRDAVLDFEKNLIKETLMKNSWNVSKTAEKLDITRQHLHRKIKILGIKMP